MTLPHWRGEEFFFFFTSEKKKGRGAHLDGGKKKVQKYAHLDKRIHDTEEQLQGANSQPPPFFSPPKRPSYDSALALVPRFIGPFLLFT